jgi:hypothetical protein
LCQGKEIALTVGTKVKLGFVYAYAKFYFGVITQASVSSSTWVLVSASFTIK